MFYYYVNGTCCQGARHHRTVQDRFTNFIRKQRSHFFYNKLSSSTFWITSLRRTKVRQPICTQHLRNCCLTCAQKVWAVYTCKGACRQDSVPTTQCRNVLYWYWLDRNVARRGRNSGVRAAASAYRYLLPVMPDDAAQLLKFSFYAI